MRSAVSIRAFVLACSLLSPPADPCVELMASWALDSLRIHDVEGDTPWGCWAATTSKRESNLRRSGRRDPRFWRRVMTAQAPILATPSGQTSLHVSETRQPGLAFAPTSLGIAQGTIECTRGDQMTTSDTSPPNSESEDPIPSARTAHQAPDGKPTGEEAAARNRREDPPA
jgi:hypothetical protein